MSALGAEKQAIEAWLASPEAYTEAGRPTLKERLARQGDLTWQLARLEAQWLEITDALERLDA